MYGQKKAIAKRTPLFTANHNTTAVPSPIGSGAPQTPITRAKSALVSDLLTPPVTEGETATDTEHEAEMEPDLASSRSASASPRKKVSRHQPCPSVSSSAEYDDLKSDHPQKRGLSQHDLLNKYFRRDTLVLRNLDLLR